MDIKVGDLLILKQDVGSEKYYGGGSKKVCITAIRTMEYADKKYKEYGIRMYGSNGPILAWYSEAELTTIEPTKD